ncbi:DEAD/DEAH box helicase [Streptomyces roseolus]|uniref:DEAD/DEAH box helicase n=2 Tax=Streptomyces TaxID=1883 RepID=UPI00378C907D
MQIPKPSGKNSLRSSAAEIPRRASRPGRPRMDSTHPNGRSLPHDDATAPAPPTAVTFADLGLPDRLIAALAAEGVTLPFPIQSATLPNALAGRDVLGRGRTGSGKTLAFGLAVLARTAGTRAAPRRPLALVLVPTRELAQQVTDALRKGVEVVVATPGRLTDLVVRGDCLLDRVSVTVLDEADQMTDMGFAPQIADLLDRVPAEGQRLLFSATLDRSVDRLVERHLTDPVVHSVDPAAGAVTTMEHHVLHVHADDKQAATAEIAARTGRVILFLDTKHAVDRLTGDLLARGVLAAALHGGKSQPQRTRALARFRTGQVPVLVATSVAARGIHVDGLDLVVNVDPPADPKDYLHRSGRTARAGNPGSVVTLVTPKQRRAAARLMSEAGVQPRITRIRPGEAELRRITGARVPSGVPVHGT